MAVLEIVLYPDPVLLRPTRALTEEEIRTGVADGLNLKQFTQDMLETMYDAPGVGLAAPQVGVGLRIHVMDTTAEKNQPLVLLNPKVIGKRGSEKGEEGCLSFPKLFGMVRRAEQVTVEYTDLAGNLHKIETTELPSRCLQHEIDHLDGILFIDKMAMTSKFSMRKDLDDLRRKYQAKKQAAQA